jgi:hypothetical protein
MRESYLFEMLTMRALPRLAHRLSAQARSLSTKVRHNDNNGVVPYLRHKYEERLAQHAMLANQSNASILSLSPDNLTNLPKTDLTSSTVARIQSDIEEMFGFGLTSSKDVFINNELDLSRVDVYGFGTLFLENRAKESCCECSMDILPCLDIF